MGEHLIEGEFQSDKYLWCKRGFFPMKFTDKNAQPLLWQYAETMIECGIDGTCADDIKQALKNAGYNGPDAETENPLQWVPFEEYVVKYGEDLGRGDTVQREGVEKSYHRLKDTVITIMFEHHETGVGMIDEVTIDDIGVFAKGRIRQDLHGKGHYGCGGMILKKEGMVLVDWRLDEVAWLRNTDEVATDKDSKA